MSKSHPLHLPWSPPPPPPAPGRARPPQRLLRPQTPSRDRLPTKSSPPASDNPSLVDSIVVAVISVCFTIAVITEPAAAAPVGFPRPCSGVGGQGKGCSAGGVLSPSSSACSMERWAVSCASSRTVPSLSRSASGSAGGSVWFLLAGSLVLVGFLAEGKASVGEGGVEHVLAKNVLTNY